MFSIFTASFSYLFTEKVFKQENDEFNQKMNQSRLHFQASGVDELTRQIVSMYVYSVIPEEQKEDLISIKTTKTQKEKRIAKEVWFAVTILGRIVMTLYSFHGLFFIYNIIIQYIILVPGILYSEPSFGIRLFIGIIYILFAACASNVLVIPTYEFLLIPYLHYQNPFYHLQSFGRVINIIEKELDKEDEEVENENENYIVVNIFLIVVEIFYFSSYLLALASITTKFKDYVKIVILFIIYVYYIIKVR